MKHGSRATRLAEARATARTAARSRTQAAKERTAAEYDAMRADQLAIRGQGPSQAFATLTARRQARGVLADEATVLALLPVSFKHSLIGGPFQRRYGAPQLFKLRGQ